MRTNLHYIGFRCGDRVRHRENPLHEGVVVAVFNWTVRVKWDGTTWKGDEHPRDLVLLEQTTRERMSAQVARNRARIGLL